MNNIEVFVVGNIGTEPSLSRSEGKKPVLWFRVACTPRVFDRDTGQMRDGQTEWVPVKAWGSYALNGHTSLRKGSRVVVRGVLREELKKSEEGERTEKVLYADSLALDLQFGTAEFRKTARAQVAGRPAPEPQPPAGGDESPPSGDESPPSGDEPPPSGDDPPPSGDAGAEWPEPALPREYTRV